MNGLSKELNNIWNEFTSYCVERLSSSDSAVKTYLDTCLPLSLEDGVLVLDVPTPFAREQIKTRFLPQMKELLQETRFGSDINIVVSEDIKKDSFAEERAVVVTESSKITTGKNGLNPNYIFSTFVVGKSNRLADAASLAAAEAPGAAYNPLFIWGKVGLGKTHLMHAIGNYVQNKRTDMKILYVSAETFTNDFISAIRNKSFAFEDFRARYRKLDVLMIDDVQFLGIGDKGATQEELFHVFNTLYNAKKQIVISCDSPPKEINGIEERLVSRFGCGLVADIQPPDLETRMAILQQKAEDKKYSIPQDVILFIAQNIPSNIRELEGALNKTVACSEFNNEPMVIENVSLWLKDLLRDSNSGPVNIGLIQKLVSETFAISLEALLSQNRSADLALARQIAMYIARNKTSESLQQIGYAFNKKDHTTVIHAYKKIEKLLKTDLRVRSFVDNIVSKL